MPSVFNHLLLVRAVYIRLGMEVLERKNYVAGGTHGIGSACQKLIRTIVRFPHAPSQTLVFLPCFVLLAVDVIVRRVYDSDQILLA